MSYTFGCILTNNNSAHADNIVKVEKNPGNVVCYHLNVSEPGKFEIELTVLWIFFLIKKKDKIIISIDLKMCLVILYRALTGPIFE